MFIEDVAEAEVRIGVVGILLEDPLEKLRGLLEVLFLSASEAGDLALDMRGQPVGRQGSVFNPLPAQKRDAQINPARQPARGQANCFLESLHGCVILKLLHVADAAIVRLLGSDQVRREQQEPPAHSQAGDDQERQQPAPDDWPAQPCAQR